MKDWFEKLKRPGKDQVLIFLLTGVLLLVIALPAAEDGKPEGPADSGEIQEESEVLAQQEGSRELENRLQELLCHVQGVGKTQVMITLKSDGKRIVEKDREQSRDGAGSAADGGEGSEVSVRSSENTVYQRDGSGAEIPYVSEQQAPEIDGVLVVAQGGGEASTAKEITEAVMALFGVEAHKIKVMKME